MTLKKLLILIIYLFFFTALSGCEKTITLGQEVLLNTGEKIVVTWIVDYNLQGDAGNPLNIKMRPKLIKTMSFNYHGNEYRYHGDATLFLLAISPEGRPNLVLHPNGFAWNWKNNYRCTTPYYAQLIPDKTGENWTFPPNIEGWLYGLRGNLSRKIFHEKNPKKIKSAYQTIQEEYSSKRTDEAMFQFVDPNYTTDDCIKEKPNAFDQ